MEEKRLEEFRKEWKDELNQKQVHKPDRSDTSHAGHPQLDQQLETLKGPSVSNKDPTVKLDTDVESKSLQKTPEKDSRRNSFQPFIIAEDLLSGSSSVGCLTPDAASIKRKNDLREELFVSRNKRLKILSPESSVKKSSDSLLDILIADLDEISEIPFFDVQIPRELAIDVFKYLGAIDLCRCSQVSKAWKSLADDELLWSKICHKLGYEEDTVTNDKREWKMIVKDHILQEKRLNLNWRMRTGKSVVLDYAKGGVLCSATSHKTTVAAGYTNGDIKVWDVLEDDSCTLRPSNTALVLDETNDSGTISNYSVNLVMNDNYTIASYAQGNIDVWKNQESLDPVHSIQCSQSSSCLRGAGNTPIFSALHGNIITTEAQTEPEGSYTHVEVLQMEEKVNDIRLVPKSPDGYSCDDVKEWSLVISQYDQVRVHTPGEDQGEMAVLHHVALQAVSAVDCSCQYLTVGVRADMLYQDHVSSIRVYDLRHGRESSNHDSLHVPPSIIRIRDCPPQSFLTGGWNRKVHLYDTRIFEPVTTFVGHAGPITCVQMDDWKVISGSGEGMVCVWDQRMGSKLWDFHNRHPVKYMSFTDKLLISANIPATITSASDEYDSMVHKRHRGALHAYDFSVDQFREGIPEVCLSTYDQPEGYSYNINLATPYDRI